VTRHSCVDVNTLEPTQLRRFVSRRITLATPRICADFHISTAGMSDSVCVVMPGVRGRQSSGFLSFLDFVFAMVNSNKSANNLNLFISSVVVVVVVCCCYVLLLTESCHVFVFHSISCETCCSIVGKQCWNDCSFNVILYVQTHSVTVKIIYYYSYVHRHNQSLCK